MFRPWSLAVWSAVSALFSSAGTLIEVLPVKAGHCRIKLTRVLPDSELDGKLLRMETDYAGWDGTCAASDNCEAWVSDWYGNTYGEFRTFRAPHLDPLPGEPAQ